MTSERIFVGDSGRFAVECILKCRVEEWVYGQFFIWAGGDRLGDEDDATALNASFNWAKDLQQSILGLVNDEYFSMPTSELGRRLLLMTSASSDDLRYSLTHIGMSSFDRRGDSLAVVLSGSGTERLLWKSGPFPVRDILLRPGEVIRVIDQAILEYERAVPRLPRCVAGRDG